MWDLVSFVKRGKIRREIMSLLNAPKSPSDLAKKTKYHRSAISRAILELEKKGLVECLTPNESVGRLYRISGSGKKILEKI